MIETIFDKGKAGRNATSFPSDAATSGTGLGIPAELLRGDQDGLDIPDVPEVEIVRHYVELSRKNYGIDNGIYPLGSCTMKYNPKVHESIASMPGFCQVHPLQALQSAASSQGILRVLHEMASILASLTGMSAFTLQPAAGAHGEFTGLLAVKRAMMQKGLEKEKNKIIVPDTSHGTNPASAAACNFEVIEIESDEYGLVDVEALKKALAPGDVAGIMLTNPNTLGLFEERILEITGLVHEAGGLCYYDGANLNGLCGLCRPGDMGFDVVHVNLHKTFATPHGGGGPGAGPVGAKEGLEEFLPGPRISMEHGEYGIAMPEGDWPGSIKAFHGNIGVILRAYCYVKALGVEGLRKSTRCAVLNANYLKAQLKGTMRVPYEKRCYHEFVGSDEGFPNGVTTDDIAKRMLDLGVHSPTIYFPLVVHGALMIEPTETESRSRLDGLLSVMKRIRAEAENDPATVKKAPVTTPVKRLDQVRAARSPVLTVSALRDMDEKRG
ncbi:MAG: aminomethyl-transferring glycine dehydrogenase subunit GcvPB [Candidatus Lokiarchaeota archaeon]|nr:aminomethyl-transferring glycine dehydrogenase subunit GcvPB [Candidatus Lokiarchaeota archaeon]